MSVGADNTGTTRMYRTWCFKVGDMGAIQHDLVFGEGYFERHRLSVTPKNVIGHLKASFELDLMNTNRHLPTQPIVEIKLKPQAHSNAHSSETMGTHHCCPESFPLPIKVPHPGLLCPVMAPRTTFIRNPISAFHFTGNFGITIAYLHEKPRVQDQISPCAHLSDTSLQTSWTVPVPGVTGNQ